MSDTPRKILVSTEGNGYLVSVLGQAKDVDSYIEVLIRPEHPLHDAIHTKACILKVAGSEATVEGVGESHTEGVFSTTLDPQQALTLLMEK